MVRPLADAFGHRGVTELSRTVQDEGLALPVPVQCRVKQWSSVAQKFSRVQPPSNIAGLQDLVGFRVITLYRSQFDSAAAAVERTFRIKKRYDTHLRLGTDQFGYSSIHYVVEPPSDWHTADGQRLFGRVTGEIQLRTLAQHLWAAASHDLQYKSEASVPAGVARAVHRAAALLELVDIELERVLEQRQNYREKIGKLGSDEPLNADVVAVVLGALWPAAHKLPNERYEVVVSDAAGAGITTQRQLAETILRHRDAVLEVARQYATRIVRAVDEHGEASGSVTIKLPGRTIQMSHLSKSVLERARHGVFLGHVALTAEAISMEMGGVPPSERLYF